jgi:alpha-beta hydrolase superfamily lysophospholipase
VETDALGTQYETRTITLRPDAEGPVAATLVHRAADQPTGTAVLYLHGFVDYFFQPHVADFYTAQGMDFYALDLRKHGRSLAEHQTPNFCTDLREYYEEIDEAVRLIRAEDGHGRVLLTGHSTGGLVASLWAHDHRTDGLVDALVLNSAFFDFNEPWFTREVASPVTVRLGRARPKTKMPFKLNEVYGRSIHSSSNGSWEYNLAWKPLAGFPIYAGWVAAIRTGHLRVHAGLDIPVPVFSAASTTSYKRKTWDEAARSADAVVDVEHIVRWSSRLGPLVTIARIEGGLHDLALSAPAARQRYFDEVERWLTAYLPRV